MKTINVKGVIVPNDDKWIYDWLDMESTSPQIVNDAIAQAGGDSIEVVINSGGGDVFSGSEIYTALKSYQGDVTTKIVGIAASAASVVAMAGKKVLMSPTGQLMIHNVSASAQGDYRDMEHTGDVLKVANQTIANAYMLKTGMSQKELLNMMNNETWMTPQQALDNKFIDEIMFDNNMQLVNSIGGAILPKEVINKIRNMIKHPSNPEKDKTDFLMQTMQAKLKYLKLKGDK